MVRIKYYVKSALSGIIAAAAAIMAAFVLTGDEAAIRIRSAEIYEHTPAAVHPIININTASVRELQKLNGIGSVTAQAVIEYREEHGYFNSADELLNVRGIGQATLEKLRPYVTV